MFKRAVMFETRKWDAMTIIDVLSKYKSGLWRESDLSITRGDDHRPYVYVVTLSCKEKDLQRLLNDIMKMNRNGVYVGNLYVA